MPAASTGRTDTWAFRAWPPAPAGSGVQAASPLWEEKTEERQKHSLPTGAQSAALWNSIVQPSWAPQLAPGPSSPPEAELASCLPQGPPPYQGTYFGHSQRSTSPPPALGVPSQWAHTDQEATCSSIGRSHPLPAAQGGRDGLAVLAAATQQELPVFRGFPLPHGTSERADFRKF